VTRTSCFSQKCTSSVVGTGDSMVGHEADLYCSTRISLAEKFLVLTCTERQ
jgi:hypothetical protein